MSGFEIQFPVVLLGAIIGMTYGLLGVGLILVYRSGRVINFAHGEVGAFAASTFGLFVIQDGFGLPYWLMFPLAIVLGFVISAVIEAAAVRRLRNAPAVMSIVVTIGAASVLNLLSFAVNADVQNAASFPQPPGVPAFDVGALRITPAYTAMLIISPLLVAGLAYFLRRSRYGIAMLAAAQNPEAAIVAGVSASMMSTLAWGLAGAVSAFSAILQFPSRGIVTVGLSLGPALLVRALAVAVVARLRSLPIAIGSGVALGIFEQVMLSNRPTGGEVEVGIFLVILLALLTQARGGTRDADRGSWVMLQAWSPLPERLAAIPLVRRLGPIAAGLALAVLLALLLATNAGASVMTRVLAFGLIGTSVYIVTGLGGQLSLGQFALAGVGAIFSVHYIPNTGDFLGGFLGAGIVAALAGVLIGVPALRIRGLMLAVVSLAFAVMAQSWLFGRSWAFGRGLSPDKPVVLMNILDFGKEYYAFILPWFAVGLWLVWNLSRGGIRRRLVALRDNEDGARAFGLPATRLKLQTFAVAGFLAGLGGAMYAHGLPETSAGTFAAASSITILAISVIGGLSILPGAIIGALYLVALPEFVPLDSVGLAATEFGWLLLILYFPGGLAQIVRPLRDRLVDTIARRGGMDPKAIRAEDHMTVSRGVDLSDVAGHTTRGAGRPGVSNGPESRQRGVMLLQVKDVTKRYGGVTAVDQASLQVRRGEILGLIGPNGAGKTTLFEIIGGFTSADSGTVTFDGHDITRLSPEERVTRGLVRSFQDARLFPTMTVLDAIRVAHERRLPTSFAASLAGLPSAGKREREKEASARDLVDTFGLAPYRSKRIAELSTGTRRITELACVVALRPSLVLLDEPSSGIAQRESEALGTLLAALRGRLGMTLVVIEHDIPLLMSLADRVVAMDAGRVIAAGTPDAVRNNPLVIESYLGGDVRAVQRSGAVARQQPVPVAAGVVPPPPLP